MPATPTTTVVATTTLPVDTGELGGLDAALAPDGTIDLDAALGLVAAGYAPLPGVTPASAALADGGPALRTVVASVAELTPQQQTAVAGIIAPTGTPLATAATSASPLTAATAAVVGESLATFGWTAAQVPVAIVELPFDNGDGTHNFSSSAALATSVVVSDGDTPECRLRVDDAAVPTEPAFVAAVARETYHCGQYLRTDLGPDVPAWVVEGAAAYAADRVAGPTPVTAAAWQRWVGQPQRPLPSRTSDAIGFFALVAESADPFAFAAALLGDPGVDSVRRRLEPTDLFDRWGRQYATRGDWEGGFAFTAPGAAGLTAPRTPVALTVDGPAVALGGGDELSATAYELQAPGDVLVVTTSPGDRGAIRFANGQTAVLAQATQSVCLLPAGCACPGVATDALNVGDAGGADVFVGIGPSSGTAPARPGLPRRGPQHHRDVQQRSGRRRCHRLPRVDAGRRRPRPAVPGRGGPAQVCGSGPSAGHADHQERRQGKPAPDHREEGPGEEGRSRDQGLSIRPSRRPDAAEVAAPGVDRGRSLDEGRHERLGLEDAGGVAGVDVVDGGAGDGPGHGELPGRCDHVVVAVDDDGGGDVDLAQPGPGVVPAERGDRLGDRPRRGGTQLRQRPLLDVAWLEVQCRSQRRGRRAPPSASERRCAAPASRRPSR